MTKHSFLGGSPIDPKPVTGSMTVAELVESAFLAYNAGRLREACQLFVEKMLEDDVTIGMSLTGALTPAGLGMSAIISTDHRSNRLGRIDTRQRKVQEVGADPRGVGRRILFLGALGANAIV